MKPHQAVRLAVLLLGVTGSGVAVLRLVGPWLPVGATPSAEVGGFADLVSTACALALVTCWGWWTLGTLLVAVASLRGTSASGRWRRWVPGTVRLLVPVLLGAAVSANPASATTDVGPSTGTVGGSRVTLAGLPMPERLATSPGPASGTVLVRPGDSLWRITERLLPAGSPVPVVDRGWRRIARANAAQVPDPDVILPGTRLRVPPLTTHPREESS